MFSPLLPRLHAPLACHAQAASSWHRRFIRCHAPDDAYPSYGCCLALLMPPRLMPPCRRCLPPVAASRPPPAVTPLCAASCCRCLLAQPASCPPDVACTPLPFADVAASAAPIFARYYMLPCCHTCHTSVPAQQVAVTLLWQSRGDAAPLWLAY